MKQLIRFITVLFYLLSSLSVWGGSSFSETEVLAGKVSISIPDAFMVMPDDMVDIKYPRSKRPTEVFSDQSTQVNLVLNYTGHPISERDLVENHQRFSDMFCNFHPLAEWKRDEIIEQNGHPFIVFELITPAIDTQIHNIIYVTSVDNRLLLASFNTTIEKATEWLPEGQKMMRSLKIK